MGCCFMPKGIPKKRYTGEFKQEVVATMMREKLSYREAVRQFGIMIMTVYGIGSAYIWKKAHRGCT